MFSALLKDNFANTLEGSLSIYLIIMSNQMYYLEPRPTCFVNTFIQAELFFKFFSFCRIFQHFLRDLQIKTFKKWTKYVFKHCFSCFLYKFLFPLNDYNVTAVGWLVGWVTWLIGRLVVDQWVGSVCQSVGWVCQKVSVLVGCTVLGPFSLILPHCSLFPVH